MRQSRMVEEIRAIRQRMYEEEKRLGRDEFLRRERERVKEFIRGTKIEVVPPDDARMRRLRRNMK